MKILTAIGDKKVLNKIKKRFCNYYFCDNDILYKEGVTEYLEIENNFDYAIINESLIRKY